eukprot:TRINITY_DN17631_c0_g2_i6.p1 TRINITY_DN17631_c0_g2~~TRINITY_DN17631_c0_g2_i6.p1  ORF type:complete len:279 (+),score=1.13 TRINITY_DN17631_c0_g2_i6:615-1451(+)
MILVLQIKKNIMVNNSQLKQQYLCDVRSKFCQNFVISRKFLIISCEICWNSFKVDNFQVFQQVNIFKWQSNFCLDIVQNKLIFLFRSKIHTAVQINPAHFISSKKYNKLNESQLKLNFKVFLCENQVSLRYFKLTLFLLVEQKILLQKNTINYCFPKLFLDQLALFDFQICKEIVEWITNFWFFIFIKKKGWNPTKNSLSILYDIVNSKWVFVETQLLLRYDRQCIKILDDFQMLQFQSNIHVIMLKFHFKFNFLEFQYRLRLYQLKNLRGRKSYFQL